MNYIPHIETYGKPFKNYAVVLEQGAADQMSYVLRQDWVLQGALMADAHSGYTLPIGGVVKTLRMVSPSFVGVDIGCGVCSQLTSFNKEKVFENRYKIRDLIRSTIPLGKNHHKRAQKWKDYEDLSKTDWFKKAFDEKGGFKQLGTLGGGNHFIEVDYDEQDRVWITIHSGSRNVGHTTAQHYIALAHPEGKVKDGAYAFDVDSKEGIDYIKDLNVCLEFALYNRKLMIENIVKCIQKFVDGEASDMFINRTHNHAESEDGIHWIHRKGATHALKDMYGVIPGNMLDGCFIVKGKGNEASLYSSSHGAGRLMSRKKASQSFILEEVQEQMVGIAGTVHESTLDEAPGAYKNIYEVIDLQSDLIDVVHHIRPIINVKG